MKSKCLSPDDGCSGNRWRSLLACLAWLGLLMAFQGWQTLALFGQKTPWAQLLDDQPVVSGHHAQHLYLGTLGARSLKAGGCSCCYDPSFQAGYPKTPVFNGSRLAECFLFLSGGDYHPRAYKIGLAAVCMSVPLLLFAAAWGAGLSSETSSMATAAGLLVWWSALGREALDAGNVDFLLAGLAGLAHVGMLMLFDRRPGVLAWLGLLLTGSLGWFAQPLLFPLLLPLLLTYFITVGVKHSCPSWHFGLLAAEALPLAIHFTWIFNWLSFWWIRSPLPQTDSLRDPYSFLRIWDLTLWGNPFDSFLAMILLGSGVVGVVLLNQMKRRAVARHFGLGMVGLLTLTLFRIDWEPFGQIGTRSLLLPALWFAVMPAAFAWNRVFALLRSLVRGPIKAWAVLLVLVGAAVLLVDRRDISIPRRLHRPKPLSVGLTASRQKIVETLAMHTGPDARILWQDHRGTSSGNESWSALLPLLTERSYLGGIDSDATIEHSSISLDDGKLAGVPLEDTDDDSLSRYCDRYNVGWIVCWSKNAIERFANWTKAQSVTRLEDGSARGQLFKIERERSFALKGQARLIHADSHYITLADVVPENGVVVLSLHFQSGMQASPARVAVEREPSAHDPIGFIRLRVGAPVARVTLTWGP